METAAGSRSFPPGFKQVSRRALQAGDGHARRGRPGGRGDLSTPSPSGLNESAVHEYVVEVRPSDGETFRTTVEQGKVVDPDKGAVVGVKVDPKTRKVVFDNKDPRLNPDAVLRTLREQEQARSRAR